MLTLLIRLGGKTYLRALPWSISHQVTYVNSLVKDAVMAMVVALVKVEVIGELAIVPY